MVWSLTNCGCGLQNKMPQFSMGHSSLVGGHLDHTNSSKESLKLARGEQVDLEKVASKTLLIRMPSKFCQKPVMVNEVVL